jgi:purine-binding chemotaxis protein CheW
LGARFGNAQTEPSRRTCIIIVEIEAANTRHNMGVMVDAVNEVLDISTENLEPAPSFGADVRADFIRGMGRVGDHFVILLDLKKVLSVDELTHVQKLATAPQ